MLDINKRYSFIILGGLIAFLFIIDLQCYNTIDACLPDLGYVVTAPGILSDDKVLLDGLEHGKINPEWKEKIGDVYLVIASYKLAGNYHLLPILSSVALLIVTYLFSLKVTGNRLASLVAVSVIEFSKTFMWYSDSVSYPTTWEVCLLLSLYPFKRYYIRPISFIFGFFLKAMTLAFLPLIFIRESEWKNKMAYFVIAGITIAVALSLNWIRYGGHINWQNMYYPQIGLYLLDQDMWILSAFTPVVIMLVILWKKKVEWSRFLLGAMGFTLLFQYVLPIISNYNAYGYRMLPFVIFFALSVSLIISKLDILIKRNVPIRKETM